MLHSALRKALTREDVSLLYGDPAGDARLRQAGMRLLPVPRGADGPDLAVMARLVEQHRPRFYVTVSVLHNPPGHRLSAAQAHQVLKLAEAGDFRIVEDDSHALLAPNQAPRLSTLDGLRRTVYVSGFSKILTLWRRRPAAASSRRRKACSAGSMWAGRRRPACCSARRASRVR